MWFGAKRSAPSAAWGVDAEDEDAVASVANSNLNDASLNTDKMRDLLTQLRAQENLCVNEAMHKLTQEFKDPALEHHFLNFYVQSSLRKMRTALTGCALAIALAALMAHVKGDSVVELLGPLYSALVCTGVGALVVRKWDRVSKWLHLDLTVSALLLPAGVLCVFALRTHSERLRDTCKDDDVACLRDRDFRAGFMAAMLFSMWGLLLVSTLRRVSHLLAHLAANLVLYVVVFLILEKQRDIVLPIALMLLVATLLLGGSRSHDLFLRRQYVWNVDTVRLLLFHLRKLEQVQEHKRKVVGYLFHEVRNPINNIVLATSIALESVRSLRALPPAGNPQQEPPAQQPDNNDPTPQSNAAHNAAREELQDMVAVVHSSAKAASHVLDDALDLQKLEAGNFVFVQSAFMIPEMYETVVAAFRAQCKLKGMQLEVHEDSQLKGLKVKGDLKRLRQVVHNFLSNAIKFSPKDGTIRVAVTADGPINGPVHVRVAVSDQGAGIAEEDRGKIFEAYSQIRAGEMQAGGGTGLGLAMSKDFIERGHAGTIGFASPGDLGQGSTFYFSIEFPRAPADDHDDGATVPEAQPALLLDSPTEGSHMADAVDVLIVEDSALTRRLVARLLKDLGVSFDECENGREAVDRVRENKYRLVLMDKEMPVMDGLQATRAIRAFNTSVPIVGVTGNAMDFQRQEFLAIGVNRVMSKPLGKEGLVSLLRQFGVLAPQKTAPRSSLG